MAVRSDYQEAPEVEPSLDAPNDYSRAQPGRGATSAAEGLGALGAGLLDASKFYGQVAADNGTNNTLEQVTHVLHGDPSKMVLQPDGTMAPDTGFFGKRGADAMSARAETDQQIKEIIDENRATLSTPQARLQYDTETRRYRAQWQTQMGSHADEQQKVWATNVNTNNATLQSGRIAQNYTNDAIFADAQQQLRTATVKNAQLQFGSDPTVAQGAIAKADQQAALTRVRAALGANDGVSAQKYLDQNRGALASLPDYDTLNHQVQDGVFNQVAIPSAQAFTNNAVAGATAAVNGNTYLASVRGRENAGGAPDAKNPHSSATGNAQFLSKTWYDPAHPEASVMGQPQFKDLIAGKSPAEILAMRSDPSISDQGTLAYAQMNSAALQGYGDPVNSATVGLAHGFGPAGAHAILNASPDTPMSSVLPHVIGANPELANKTAGQVVQSFNSRFGTGAISTAPSATAGGHYPTSADALNDSKIDLEQQAQTEAQRLFPKDGVHQERYVSLAMRGVNQHISQLDDAIKVDSHVVESAIATGNPITIEQLRATSPEVAAAYDRMAVENPYAYLGIEKRLSDNAHGAAINFGGQYSHFFDLVTRDPKDPQAITRPDQLNTFVGRGKNAFLTNTGIGTLSQITALNQGPQGHTQVAQIRQIMNVMHGNLSFSSPTAGLVDPKGEEKFAQFSSVAIPALISAAKSGQLPQLLDPKSPSYIGNMATPFLRTDIEKMNDQVTGAVHVKPTPIQGRDSHAVTQQLRQIPGMVQRQQALRDAVRAGIVPKAVADKIILASGWAPAQASATPAAPADTDDTPFEQ